jgi:hypothetical protein
MSLENIREASNQRMVEISEWIDPDEEAARLQGAALTGMLAGVWLLGGLIETGPFDAYIAASILTVIGISGIAIRAVT